MGLFDFNPLKKIPVVGDLVDSLLPGGKADIFTGETGIFTNPEGAWDTFTNGKTNTTNEKIAQENLAYQRERNAIEDARYEEETAYNRAFAEDERDYQREFAEDEREYQRNFAEEQREYNRALQQQIFDREDTAIERQANSLSRLGINPLSQQMNGLGAGSVVSSSLPGGASAPSASEPSMSSRGGSALHNDFQMRGTGIAQVLGSLMDTANAIDNINTAGVQRDSLRQKINLDNADYISKQLQNEAQMLSNLKEAKKLGATKDDNGNWHMPDYKHTDQDFNLVDYENKEASKNRNVREDIFQNDYGTTDSSTMPERVATGTTKQFERFIDGAKSLGNSIGNTIVESGKNDLNRIKRFYNWSKEKIQNQINKRKSNNKKERNYLNNSNLLTH